MTFLEAKAEIREILRLQESVRARLRIVESSLPAAPDETDTKDFASHPQGSSGLRIAIETLLNDLIGPAIRELRAALDIEDENES